MSEGSHRKQYMLIFLYLGILTALEIGVADPRIGIPRGTVAFLLVSMALTKAALVAFYYMHLKTETKVLKYVVLLPAVFPPFYALVLMAEAAVRMLGA